jgi:chemotaxis protein MotB
MTAPSDTEESPGLTHPLAVDAPEEGTGTSPNGWMVTFADVLALLLTFFVMMYAMNDVREDEWKGFVQAMTGHFNPASPPADFQVRDGISDTSVFERKGMDLGYLQNLIANHLDSAETAGAYDIIRRADRLVIRLPEVLIVQDGQPVLTQKAQAAARELGQVLGTLSNRVSVNGHAARGTNSALYPSAWELSLAAATIVADTIRQTGLERDILVLGRGDADLKTPAAGRDNDEADDSESGLSWGRVDVVVRDTEARRRRDDG